MAHLLIALLIMAAPPQEMTKSACTCAPREVGDSGSRENWTGYAKGVRWHYSVKEALEIAKAEKKLVFWYHLVGDLDKEGC